MKIYKYARTEEPVYYHKLKNGLTICVLPSTNQNSYYAVLGVKYGSMDIEFIPIGEEAFFKTNLGIAHFLEHKAFAMENFEEPFSFFAKNGANSNASTSFQSTKYYIWGVDNFKENLDYLLKFVYSPYFTKENIQKEVGIISEEIRMYDDDPSWVLDDTAREINFNVLPCRDKIAGSYESIKNITKEELYKCYNTFYVPNNMILVVSGNITNEDVMDVIKNHEIVNNLKPNYNIIRKEYDESIFVKDEYKQIKMNVQIPKVKYSFKLKRDQFSIKDKYKLDMYLNIILSIYFGTTSEFYELIFKDNLVSNYFVELCYYQDFYLLEFNAESDKGDIFKDLVDEYIKKIQINEKDLERMKRVWIASEIKLSDHSDAQADNLLEDFLQYDGKICTDRINVIESLKLGELNKIIKELNFNNSSFVLINPKEEQ